MSISFRGFLPRLEGGFDQEHRPILNKRHESSRKGVFLCGDIAGQPLLKTSMQDAIETVDCAMSWLDSRKRPASADCDVVVCGGGGSGLAAALRLKQNGYSCVVLEKDRVAQTIQDFPEAKIIYARPYNWEINSPMNIADCSKKEFLDKCRQIIQDEGLDVRENHELAEINGSPERGLTVSTTDREAVTGMAVIVAVGRRGNARKLGVEGEDLPHVHDKLLHPHGYEGRRAFVVGGGNNAVEAAISLADNGADVTLSYRREQFFRASKYNQAELQKREAACKIKVMYRSEVATITEASALVRTPDGDAEVPVDDVFVMIGAEPPNRLLRRLGIRIENTWNYKRWIGFALVFVGMWLFYSFGKWSTGTTWQEFPWGLMGASWENLPEWLKPTHFKAFVYSVVVVGCGIPALMRWRGVGRIPSYQTARYAVIFASQVIFLFVFPEFILPAINDALELWQSGNYWRWYGVVMPFPLVYDTFFYSSPDWFWIVICGLAAFVILPLFVYWHGKRLCSWICGCGCLAETLGDRFRHYAPQGDGSRKIENYLLWPVLIWAFVSAGAFIFISGDAAVAPWYVTAYRGIVDFLLAAVLGVALYFFLGNRIWCRYFCPLAHYMRLLSAWYGKFRIKPADRCIACGECTRYCQMGIDVMRFALKDEQVNNRNSSCIGCGICVSVCPMDNLTMGEKFPNEK